MTPVPQVIKSFLLYQSWKIVRYQFSCVKSSVPWAIAISLVNFNVHIVYYIELKVAFQNVTHFVLVWLLWAKKTKSVLSPTCQPSRIWKTVPSLFPFFPTTFIIPLLFKVVKENGKEYIQNYWGAAGRVWDLLMWLRRWFWLSHTHCITKHWIIHNYSEKITLFKFFNSSEVKLSTKRFSNLAKFLF